MKHSGFVLFFSTILNCFAAISTAQTTMILSPSEDAPIGYHDGFNSANTNYKTADFFDAFSQPGAIFGENAGRAMMKFDLSDIPAGVTIVSARLDLYGRGPYGAGDAVSNGNYGLNESYLERVTSYWNDSTVTWNTQPSSTSTDHIVLAESVDSIQDYLDVDVTPLVQDMVNDPSNSFGFMFRLVTEYPTRSLVFCSKDFSDSTKHPQLTIVYSCSEPIVYTLYPNHDAIIGFHDGFNTANSNFGTADFYSAFSQPGAIGGENAGAGLMSFDLGTLPPGVTIISASLDLFGRGPYGAGDAVSIGNTGQNDSYLQRITSSWNESTVTWNTQPSTTTANEITLPASISAIQDYPGIDVTQMIQDMIDTPSASYGFKIVLQTEDPTRSLAFCSRDYADSSKFPKLTITYSCSYPATAFSAADTSVCEKFCIDFFDQSTNNPTSWSWVFSGGSPASSTQQNPEQVCYNFPGVYDVTLLTSGAFGTDTLTLPGFITVLATPPAPTITQVGYTLTSSTAYSYQWQLNAVDIPGATDQSYSVLQSGYYTVVVSNENGCVNSFSLYVLLSGMDEIAIESTSMFPNPAVNQVNIDFSRIREAVSSLRITDEAGKVLMERKTSIENQQLKIDVSNFAAGIYFVEMLTPSQKFYSKLEVQK